MPSRTKWRLIVARKDKSQINDLFRFISLYLKSEVKIKMSLWIRKKITPFYLIYRPVVYLFMVTTKRLPLHKLWWLTTASGDDFNPFVECFTGKKQRRLWWSLMANFVLLSCIPREGADGNRKISLYSKTSGVVEDTVELSVDNWRTPFTF